MIPFFFPLRIGRGFSFWRKLETILRKRTKLMKLKGKVAIITGASKGIGKGIALRFSQEGAAVVLASRSLDLLSAIVDQVRNKGGRAMALDLDVTRYESVEKVVNQTVEHFGRLDIMVNNAGISMAKASEDLSPLEWARAL
jgi:NAD(P)-dependent dehydrogenase (short-subunit alcohol dehydrogenase family)